METTFTTMFSVQSKRRNGFLSKDECKGQQSEEVRETEKAVLRWTKWKVFYIMREKVQMKVKVKGQ